MNFVKRRILAGELQPGNIIHHRYFGHSEVLHIVDCKESNCQNKKDCDRRKISIRPEFSNNHTTFRLCLWRDVEIFEEKKDERPSETT